MTKIRVLEVVSGFGLGGAEKALAARMKYIPDEYNQTILNVRPEIDNFKPHAKFQEFKIRSRNLRRILLIRKFLKTNHFDVVIVRTPVDAIRIGLIKRFTNLDNLKLIFEAHSNFVSKKPFLGKILSVLLRYIARNIDLVIAVSDNVLKGPLCRGQKNIEKIYLGADLDIPENTLESCTHPHLLFVGRLIDLKRPIWLLQRVKKLSKTIPLPKPSLTMIGSGPLEQAVIDFIRSNELTEYVRFVGRQDDISPYFASATHLVSCSTNEGLPLSFFEAKLAGLSIVATPSGGGSEIFDKEDLELNSFDKSEFEKALAEILSSPPPSLDTKKAIRTKSLWMKTSENSRNYYSLIARLVDN